MYMCMSVCVCVCVCVCARARTCMPVHALKIVAPNKILCWINTLIIINGILYSPLYIMDESTWDQRIIFAIQYFSVCIKLYSTVSKWHKVHTSTISINKFRTSRRDFRLLSSKECMTESGSCNINKQATLSGRTYYLQ